VVRQQGGGAAGGVFQELQIGPPAVERGWFQGGDPHLELLEQANAVAYPVMELAPVLVRGLRPVQQEHGPHAGHGPALRQ
jgi:hypothetical protein